MNRDHKTKHIFFVQSNISKLIALQTISFLNISPSDCIFLLGRKTILKEEYILSYDIEDFTVKSSINLIKSWKNLFKAQQKITNFVKRNIPHDFVLYTSSFSYYFIKNLIKRKNCTSYNFLEEGYAAYMTKKERIVFSRKDFLNINTLFFIIKTFLAHLFLYRFEPFSLNKKLDKCEAIYVSTKDAFPDFNNTIIIGLPFKKIEAYKNIQVIFAPSYLVESKKVSISTFVKLIEEVLSEIRNSEYSTLHIKFHPVHYNAIENINLYRNTIAKFDDDLNIIELNNEDSLENIAFSSDAVFYLGITSTALYAKLCGNKINSYCDKLLALDSNFISYLEVLPNILKKIIFK